MIQPIKTLIILLCIIPIMGNAVTVMSPDKSVKLDFTVKDGTPYYAVSWNGESLIESSKMGFMLADDNLCNGMKHVSSSRNSHDETWYQVWGEEETVRNNYNELTVKLRQKQDRQLQLNVIFRVFNDGVGFRYIIPNQKGLDNIIVREEMTEFNLAHDSEAWSIPTNRTEYYEGIYTKELVSMKDTVCTPLTIEFVNNIYMAIHEAALEDYATLNLAARGKKLIAALTPWSDGMKVYAKESMKSPWRTIIFGSTAGELLTNRVMLNLNEPCAIEDTSWIEPGRYIGIWWNIHKKENTWEMGPKHGATTNNLKRYIDFAAKHGFSGVLSEGWNPGWRAGEQVTFLKTYPDFDINEVTRYAKEKGVRWIGHMESWGNAQIIEKEMEEAFAWYNSLGVNTVKTGYVSHMMDNKEKPSSQYGIRHYRKIIECAAKHKIMIDNHEPAMPTGLQRTFPNLMTQEGARGQEYNAWDRKGGNPPEHTVTLPFTRGLAGPIDFTPAIFNFSEVVQGTRPQSTIAKQLAEFLVIYSPLQMAADAIENYNHHPALSFIESCPTTWSHTIIANGEIGKYITTCRKERNGERWFIGSMTNADARAINITLDFLGKGKTYKATIYEDGIGADYQKNPLSLNIRQIEVTATDVLHLYLARSGGAAIRLEPKN